MFYLFGDPYVMYDFPHKRHLPGPVNISHSRYRISAKLHQDLVLKHIETHGFGGDPFLMNPRIKKGLKSKHQSGSTQPSFFTKSTSQEANSLDRQIHQAMIFP